ncbi:MAG: hypothetical protein KF724_07345 [Phycisphaeraceae bacterium]|nr:hypothetical protein [Phycisphaeraceae bacterium]
MALLSSASAHPLGIALLDDPDNGAEVESGRDSEGAATGAVDATEAPSGLHLRGNMGPAPGEQPPGATPTGAATPPGAPGGDGSAPSPQELANLKTLLESLPVTEQQEMLAFYRDLGFDLDQLLGLGAARMAQMGRGRQIIEMFGNLAFARQPAAVLDARSRLALGDIPHPDLERGDPGEIARWIHLQFLAGDWEWLRNYLINRPRPEAEIVYAGLLQSIRPNAGLLPEEVIAIAELASTAPTRAQVVRLGALLQQAAERHATAEMVTRLRAGSRFFGMDDSERRQRTIDLLTAAGLLRDASEYLPPLDDARAAGDGQAMLAHAAHELARAERSGGADAEPLRRRAWAIAAEVALMDKVPFETRRQAMGRAMAMMPSMPRPMVRPWLERVFDDEALGQVALEVMAATAISVGDANRDREERARTIVALKEAVDMLLTRHGADSPAFQLPLRMLTTSLVNEMEAALRGSDESVQQMPPWMMMAPQRPSRDVESLARAIPSEAWLRAIEPSLALRTAAAGIAIATSVDDIDLALTLLREASARSPTEAERLANTFLARWQGKLGRRMEMDDDMYFYFSRWNMNPAAPVTRGRQRRNLDRVREMVASLRAIGVETNQLPLLVQIFNSCHGATEVFQREDVERVFGPIEGIPPWIAVSLAQTMAANLGGEWRDRAVHRRAGVRRTDAEIAALVDRGYGLALDLMDSALVAQPESWRLAVMKSALAYDRQSFLEQQRSTPSGALAEVRAATFATFEEAARRYALAVSAGEEREDVEVFLRWFGVAMGSPGLRTFRSEDIPSLDEGVDDPVERIRRALAALPPEVAERHVAELARAITGFLGGVDASVKPKLVRHALRIIGDNPAGAPLRTLDTLYHELIRDEIRLRLTIDGDDRVGVKQPFGVLLTLRSTAAVEREVGGFAKYLQTSVPIWTSGRYQEKNHRETLEKDIREAFGKGIELQTISFFDPFVPPRGVIEDGQDGWVEKPLAYLVVTRQDATVDRLPSVPMEMQFSDSMGPVTLVALSNAPALAVGAAFSARPCPDLEVVQVVDAREASDSSTPEIRLEVRMRGRGIVPDLEEALSGITNAIAGYAPQLETARVSPIVALGDDQTTMAGRWFMQTQREPKGGYPEPDERGIYRPTFERSWTITYLPTGGDRAALGGIFTLPTLRPVVAGAIENRQYVDMDIIPVTGPTVAVTPRASPWRTLAMMGGAGAVALVAIGGVLWIRRRQRHAAPALTEVKMPQRITPMSTVTTLRRLRDTYGGSLPPDMLASLDAEIGSIEAHYFGPEQQVGSKASSNGDLDGRLRSWVTRLERRA